MALVGAGIAMAPWLFVLAVSLPSTTIASHWSTAWVGLDGAEALGLIATGTLLYLKNPRHCLAAAATATLLVADAWFDVTTAVPGAGRETAAAMAVCPEIPMSILCAVLALRALPRREV